MWTHSWIPPLPQLWPPPSHRWAVMTSAPPAASPRLHLLHVSPSGRCAAAAAAGAAGDEWLPQSEDEPETRRLCPVESEAHAVTEKQEWARAAAAQSGGAVSNSKAKHIYNFELCETRKQKETYREQRATELCSCSRNYEKVKIKSLYIGRSPPAGPGDLLTVWQHGNKSSIVKEARL